MPDIRDAKNVNYLVTGAAGFIGMHICRKLLETGSSVAGYDNLNDYYDVSLKKKRLKVLEPFEKFSFVAADINDRKTLFDTVKKNDIDVIIHLAAQAGVRYSLENPDVYIESNIVGFHNILEAAKEFKIKHLVYASSSSVYGSNEKVPFSVSDRTDSPVSLYAATKKAGEIMAHSYCHLFGIPATGVRFFSVYGPYGRPDMAYYSFARAIIEGTPIKVFNNGDMHRDFTYIDDVVDAVYALLEKSSVLKSGADKHKIYNIGNNKTVKLADFIINLENLLGKKAVIENMPMQKGDVYKTWADIKELTEDTGISPVTGIEQGLKKFVEWFKSVV